MNKGLILEFHFKTGKKFRVKDNDFTDFKEWATNFFKYDINLYNGLAVRTSEVESVEEIKE